MIIRGGNRRLIGLLLAGVTIGVLGYSYLQNRTRAAAVFAACEEALRQRLPVATGITVTPQSNTAAGAVNLLEASVTTTLASAETERDEVLCVVHGSQSRLGLGAQAGNYNVYKLIFAPR